MNKVTIESDYELTSRRKLLIVSNGEKAFTISCNTSKHLESIWKNIRILEGVQPV